MSIIRTAVTAVTLARTLVGHPVVRAGLAAAPLLLTPEVKAKARDVTLSAAYKAGTVARKLMDTVRR